MLTFSLENKTNQIGFVFCTSISWIYQFFPRDMQPRYFRISIISISFPYSLKIRYLPTCGNVREYVEVFRFSVWPHDLPYSSPKSHHQLCLSWPPYQHRKWTICCFLWLHNTHIHTHPQPGPPSILSKSPILCFLALVKAASITFLPPAYVLGGLHALTVGWLYVGYVGLSFLTPCLKTMLLSLPIGNAPSAADHILGISAFKGFRQQSRE